MICSEWNESFASRHWSCPCFAHCLFLMEGADLHRDPLIRATVSLFSGTGRVLFLAAMLDTHGERPWTTLPKTWTKARVRQKLEESVALAILWGRSRGGADRLLWRLDLRDPTMITRAREAVERWGLEDKQTQTSIVEMLWQSVEESFRVSVMYRRYGVSNDLQARIATDYFVSVPLNERRHAIVCDAIVYLRRLSAGLCRTGDARHRVLVNPDESTLSKFVAGLARLCEAEFPHVVCVRVDYANCAHRNLLPSAHMKRALGIADDASSIREIQNLLKAKNKFMLFLVESAHLAFDGDPASHFRRSVINEWQVIGNGQGGVISGVLSGVDPRTSILCFEGDDIGSGQTLNPTKWSKMCL